MELAACRAIVDANIKKKAELNFKKFLKEKEPVVRDRRAESLKSMLKTSTSNNNNQTNYFLLYLDSKHTIKDDDPKVSQKLVDQLAKAVTQTGIDWDKLSHQFIGLHAMKLHDTLGTNQRKLLHENVLLFEKMIRKRGVGKYI